MSHPLAGQSVPHRMLTDISALVDAYYNYEPDPSKREERVSFGTSGHRGSSFKGSFNDSHVAAITQAVCEYRIKEGYDGPLFLGKDTHALSTPAERTVIEVCAANGVQLCIAEDRGYTPTPLISFAILEHNAGSSYVADGIVITPSHNPPEDGGFKYNPPNGGPADTEVTAWIERRANELLKNKLDGVARFSYDRAMKSGSILSFDFVTPYVEALEQIVDLGAIRKAGLRLGADPMGGSALTVYRKIKEHYGLDLEILNEEIDPTFSFMSLDHDGKIRMDCSSPWAMAPLVKLKERFDLAFGNDADADRHGIVTPVGGLMNPNHYLGVAIGYLFERRKWSGDAKIGKTLVSSSMIDRVAEGVGRKVYEVPVGFKWFVEGLHEGRLGFAGEESAGASFLRFDGSVWSTDKDGIIMNLLAAEIKAVTGKDPAEIYADYEVRYGRAYYGRIDVPADAVIKARLKALSPEDIRAKTLAGETIKEIRTVAPGNGAPLGGLKIVTEDAWIALRPSGTEDLYKIYAESFRSAEHLLRIQEEARALAAKLADSEEKG
ncbi:phosphoglucomutase (alpha-D-glucose-1,6-bisphosphate-dependent) [Nitratifractor sp.]